MLRPTLSEDFIIVGKPYRALAKLDRIVYVASMLCDMYCDCVICHDKNTGFSKIELLANNC